MEPRKAAVAPKAAAVPSGYDWQAPQAALGTLGQALTRTVGSTSNYQPTIVNSGTSAMNFSASSLVSR